MFAHEVPPAEEGYGRFDRLLHRLALGGTGAVAEMSFDLDQKLCHAAASADEVAGGRHVFVAGLARAGTTVLLRALHASGGFYSLTYRDMPFPMAPNLWKRLSGRLRRPDVARIRAHGDGIAINADSPEALEELFWRIRCGEDYIRPDGLIPHRPDRQTIGLFRNYVAAILTSSGGKTRYLSKNNNSILRLPALREAFPNATILIPFRDPASHALSLWRQHQRFSRLQRQTPFIRSYMDWLAHHEFGLGHRPFLMGGPALDYLTPDDLDYWLDLWIRVHGELIRQSDRQCLFVSHEELCTDPAVWRGLSARLDVPEGVPGFVLTGEPQPDYFTPDLLREADSIHARLRDLAARSVAGAMVRDTHVIQG